MAEKKRGDVVQERDVLSVIVRVGKKTADGNFHTLGTGFLLNHEKGYVVTCTHLFQEGDQADLYIRFAVDPTEDYHTHLKECLPTSGPLEGKPGDLAYLEIDDVRSLPSGVRSILIDAGALRSGHPAVLYGYPKIEAIQGVWAPVLAFPPEPRQGYIQLDGDNNRLREGMSGAPVISESSGKLIAVFSAYYHPGSDRYDLQNLGFGLPAAWILEHQPAHWETPLFMSPTPTLNETLPRRTWILQLPKPQPQVAEDRIAMILAGFDLFSAHRAEEERAFLFHEAVGGFWSGHPQYAEIADDFSPQIVLAPPGGGKTAFAYALSQIGHSDGTPLAHTLPLCIPGSGITPDGVRQRFVWALLDYVQHNPAKFLALNHDDQDFLLSLFSSDESPDYLWLHLSEILQKTDISIKEAPSYSTETWPAAIRKALPLLGFERAVLALDFETMDEAQLALWLHQMNLWASAAIMLKLFVPERVGQYDALGPYQNKLTICWRDEDLDKMIRWRLAALSRLTAHPIISDMLFTENGYRQFIHQSRRNPGFLAQLWRVLRQIHRQDDPSPPHFLPRHLAEAKEALISDQSAQIQPLPIQSDTMVSAINDWPFWPPERRSPEENKCWWESCYYPSPAEAALSGIDRSVVIFGPSGSGRSVALQAFERAQTDRLFMIRYPVDRWPGEMYAWLPSYSHLGQIMACITNELKTYLRRDPDRLERLSPINLEFLRWLIEKHNNQRAFRRWIDQFDHQPLTELATRPFEDFYKTDADPLDVQGQIEELVTLCRRLGFEGVAILIDITAGAAAAGIRQKLQDLFRWLLPFQFDGFAVKASLPEAVVSETQLVNLTRGRVTFTALNWSATACRQLAEKHLRTATDGVLDSLTDLAGNALLTALEQHLAQLHAGHLPQAWIWLTQVLLDFYCKEKQPLTQKKYDDLLRNYYAEYIQLKIDSSRQGVWRGAEFISLDEQPFRFLASLFRHRSDRDANPALLEIAGSQGNLNTIASRLRKKIEPVPHRPIYLRNTRGQGYWLEKVADINAARTEI